MHFEDPTKMYLNKDGCRRMRLSADFFEAISKTDNKRTLKT